MSNLSVHFSRRRVCSPPRCLLLLCLIIISIQLKLLSVVMQSERRSEPVFSPLERRTLLSTTPNRMGVCKGGSFQEESMVPLYIITPTYKRGEQLPELVRLAQTLMHVQAIVWIVVDDSKNISENVVNYLKETGLCHVYLRAQMPEEYRNYTYPMLEPRGVANRNAGLDWVKNNAKSGGVIYFADDDNTYHIRLFEEIRRTKKLSMFPVGLVAGLGVSSPIIRNDSVAGFYDGAIKDRKYALDMAGFALSVSFYLSFLDVKFPFTVAVEETVFLEQLDIRNEDIEILASNCTKILVWHTRTVKSKLARIAFELDIFDTNIIRLLDQVWLKERKVKPY